MFYDLRAVGDINVFQVGLTLVKIYTITYNLYGNSQAVLMY